MSLKKDEILQHIAWKAGITKEQAEAAIKGISEVVKMGLSDENGNPKVGESQKIEGLGTWEVKATAAREGVNPQVTGAKSLVAKAEAGETVDADKLEKAKALMVKVAAGEISETLSIPAGQKAGFRPEKDFKTWVNPSDTDGE